MKKHLQNTLSSMALLAVALFTFAFPANTSAQTPTFTINGTVENEGTADLGEITENYTFEQHTIFTVKGENLEVDGKYAIVISYVAGSEPQATAYMLKDEELATIFMPGRRGQSDVINPVAGADLSKGKKIILQPQSMQPGEYTETITISKPNPKTKEDTLFSAKVKFVIPENPIPYCHIDYQVDNGGTYDAGILTVDEDSLAMWSGKIQLLGANLTDESNYYISFTQPEENAKYKVEIVDAADSSAIFTPGAEETYVPVKGSDLNDGKNLIIKFSGDWTVFDKFVSTLTVRDNEDASVADTIFSAFVNYEIVSPNKLVAIVKVDAEKMDTIEDKGTFDIGELKVVKEGADTFQSEAFTLKSPLLTGSKYLLSFTQHSTDSAVALLSGNRVLFQPAKKDVEAKYDTVLVNEFTNGLSVRLQLQKDLLGKFVDTLEVKDEEGKLLYSYAVRYQVGEIPAPEIVIVNGNDSTLDGDTIALGDIDFNKGSVLLKDKKFTLKGDNINLNTYEGLYVELKEKGASVNYEIQTIDGGYLLAKMDRGGLLFAADTLDKGLDFYFYFSARNPGMHRDMSYDIYIFDEDKVDTLFTTTVTYSLVTTPEFKINDSDRTEFKLGTLSDVKLGAEGEDSVVVLATRTFNLTAERLEQGDTYTFSISQQQKEKGILSVIDGTGKVLYAPANGDDAEVVVDIPASDFFDGRGGSSASKTLRIKLDRVGTDSIAFEETFEVKNKATGDVAFSAKLTFNVKKIEGTDVDNIELNGTVWNEVGTLCIDIDEAAHADIYTVDGKHIIGAELNAGINRIALTEGVYVVRIADSIVKAVIR